MGLRIHKGIVGIDEPLRDQREEAMKAMELEEWVVFPLAHLAVTNYMSLCRKKMGVLHLET